jgi:hypothetical protein
MPRYALTREQQAEEWGMSVRSVDTVRAIQKIRPDLAKQAIARQLSVNMAMAMATGHEPTMNTSKTWNRLCWAWNDASDEERERFCEELGLKPV